MAGPDLHHTKIQMLVDKRPLARVVSFLPHDLSFDRRLRCFNEFSKNFQPCRFWIQPVFRRGRRGCDQNHILLKARASVSVPHIGNTVAVERVLIIHLIWMHDYALGILRLRDQYSLQRLRIRVASRPDQTYRDRFHTNPDTDTLGFVNVPTRFADAAGQFVEIPSFDDGIPETNDYAEVDVWLEVFVPTGRVKILP